MHHEESSGDPKLTGFWVVVCGFVCSCFRKEYMNPLQVIFKAFCMFFPEAQSDQKVP
jgi:hypothetical protein